MRSEVSHGVARKLELHVQKVVLGFMERMGGYPAQRSLRRFGIVVPHDPFPILWIESGKYVAKHTSRIHELARHVEWVLCAVSVMICSFIPSHRFQRRTLDAPRQKDPLSLHKQHIAEMAAVLNRRPRTQLSAATRFNPRVFQGGSQLGSRDDDRFSGGGCLTEIVLKATLVAAIHKDQAMHEPTEATGPDHEEHSTPCKSRPHCHNSGPPNGVKASRAPPTGFEPVLPP